jgi:hypothetical protein
MTQSHRVMNGNPKIPAVSASDKKERVGALHTPVCTGKDRVIAFHSKP